VISLHGGGSPEAMKREIWRNYPVMEKVELVESLLERGVAADGRRSSKQPGRCCVTGCEVPSLPAAASESANSVLNAAE
jgi:4-hydroxybutyryl-CoA dehydratase/vinylacetyl-CoA-Delta-isomerase